MSVSKRWQYYRRIFSAYLGSGRSQLTFWHETPEINPAFTVDQLGPYYMLFRQKADYPGHHDADGVPMLDYRGAIGLQYNPIATAQWGLANYNLFAQTGEAARWQNTLKAADWMVSHLAPNPHGVPVWNHYFDWEYRDTLKSPWYSGLAQGQGISLLLRVANQSQDERYLRAAERAFTSMTLSIQEGGVLFEDRQGYVWIEEYIVDPPTHILNGFMWALWGVYDYWLVSADSRAKSLFERCVQTLVANLARFDTGYWSLYEQSGTRLKMLASPFYHRLHVVQLRVMARLTAEQAFPDTANRWENYMQHSANRNRALVEKSIFKLLHY